MTNKIKFNQSNAQKGRKPMKNSKYSKFLTILGVSLLAVTLSACANFQGGPGTGGLGEPTEEPSNTNATEPPAAEPPAPTPIPPATGQIIFTSSRDGQSEFYMTSPDGTQVTRLTTNAAIDTSSTPRLSPDGTKIVFSSTIAENTDIYTLDIASGSIQRITDAPGRDSSPSWSPNGQQIAFESFRDGNLEIYIVNADGSNPIRLTNDPAGDTNPVWSPVANEIVFASNRFGNSDLFLVNTNGAVSTLTTNPDPDNAATWSPDGRFIAYHTAVGSDLENVCLIGRDGLNPTCITTQAAEYSFPVWSQDGQQIAVNNQKSILIFKIFTNEMVELNQPGIEPRGTPAWSPDGLRLVFQAQTEGDMELFYALTLTNEFTRITSIPGYDGEPLWASR